jgi:hypothetical protein
MDSKIDFIGKEINSLGATILIKKPNNCPGASKVYGNSSFFNQHSSVDL